MFGVHNRDVRPFPSNTENGKRDFTLVDPHDDFARFTSFHDDCAIQLTFLTNGARRNLSEFGQQSVTVD